MINEYSRTELLIGSENMEKLKKASVAVFGVGGVGSHCIEALARCGIGRLILIDNDDVSLTNINRQSIAYHSTIGRMKTDVMRERIKDIDPNIKVETYETFVLPDNAKELLEQIGTIHYIIDAIDTVSAKIVLAELAGERNIPIISSMGTGNKLHAEMFEIISAMGSGNKLDPTKFEVTDIYKTSVCPLCKVMRKELRNRGITHLKVLYSKEKPISAEGRTTEEEKGMRRTIPGSVSFVPPVAGLLIAGEVIRSLIQAE